MKYTLVFTILCLLTGCRTEHNDCNRKIIVLVMNVKADAGTNNFDKKTIQEVTDGEVRRLKSLGDDAVREINNYYDERKNLGK